MEASLKLTEEKAAVLIDLLDVATKAAGLKVSQNALYFATEISNLFKEKQPNTPTPTVE